MMTSLRAVPVVGQAPHPRRHAARILDMPSSAGNAGAPIASYVAGNIDSRLLGALFAAAAVCYLGVYALEAPIRYVLYNAGKDNLILLRDGFIVGPLALLIAAYALRLRLHPAVVVFGMLVVFHGLVLMGTIGSALAVGYGIKIVINLLFGFFIASLLLQPGNKGRTFLALIWCITLLGVCLVKFVLTL